MNQEDVKLLARVGKIVLQAAELEKSTNTVEGAWTIDPAGREGKRTYDRYMREVRDLKELRGRLALEVSIAHSADVTS